jgi:beta-glucanase (GH16 family)
MEADWGPGSFSVKTRGADRVLTVATVVLIIVDSLMLSAWLLGPNSGSANITDANGTWRQIFADNFNTNVPVGSFPGRVYGPRWKVYLDGWKDTTKNGTYYPSRVLSVSNGVLNMYLHTEIINGVAVHMVSAPEPILPGGTSGQTYGRYSVRFYADAVPGYQTAWLLWPDSGVWPGDGEVDYPDRNLTGTIHAFMHYASPSGGQTAFSTNVPEAGAWHIATMEWQPGKVTFILDGAVIGVATTLVPFKPMHHVLQTETQLSGGAPSNTAAGNVKVDWVVIYSRA